MYALTKIHDVAPTDGSLSTSEIPSSWATVTSVGLHEVTEDR